MALTLFRMMSSVVAGVVRRKPVTASQRHDTGGVTFGGEQAGERVLFPGLHAAYFIFGCASKNFRRHNQQSPYNRCDRTSGVRVETFVSDPDAEGFCTSFAVQKRVCQRGRSCGRHYRLPKPATKELSPDYSWPPTCRRAVRHTNPKRKRGQLVANPSLALRVSVWP